MTGERKIAWVPLTVGLVIALPLLWLFARGFSFDPKDVASPLIGKPAPAFALEGLDGERVSLESLRGRPIVVNFFASWCVPCRQEHGELVLAARQLGERARFVGVIYEDEPDLIRPWLGRRAAYPTLVDPGGQMAIAYGVYGVPETFFIDAGGIIRDKAKGPVTFDRVRQALEAMP
jgi:cytochrome c biogenesis protein CcmG/thiol:disulfide interchange protein DsbE